MNTLPADTPEGANLKKEVTTEMRKTLSILLSALMIASLLCLGVSAAPAGTAVKSADDFAAMDPAGTYYLDADITVKASYGAGETIVPFTGTLDGNGHTVTVEAPMFVQLAGTVKNLKLKGAVVETGTENTTTSYAGAIAQHGPKEANIVLENITNDATVTFAYRGGSLIGQISDNSTLTMKNCVNNAKVFGGNMAGGFIGYMQGKTAVISDCVNNGEVAIDIDSGLAGVAGGIFGRFGGDNKWVNGAENNRSIKIDNCLNTGKVTGTSQVAGILAYARGSVVTINNCTNKGEITSAFTQAGTGTSDAAGIFGSTGSSDGYYNLVYINKCLNEGKVTSQNARAAGIVGYVWCGSYDSEYLHAELTDCVNKGAVAAGSYSSEILAYTNDTKAGDATVATTSMKNCYGLGSVARAAQTTREEAKTYCSIIGCSSATQPALYGYDLTLVENDGTVWFSYTETEANAASRLPIADKPDNIKIVPAADAAASAAKIDKLGYQAPAAPVTPADPGTPVKPVQTADTAVYFVAVAVVAVLGCALVSRKVNVK